MPVKTDNPRSAKNWRGTSANPVSAARAGRLGDGHVLGAERVGRKRGLGQNGLALSTCHAIILGGAKDRPHRAETVARKYRDEDLSRSEVARRLGSSRTTVLRCLRDADVPVVSGRSGSFDCSRAQDGNFTSVPHLPGADLQSDPWAINASGEIWGTGYFDDHLELWRLRDGRLRRFGTLVPGAYWVGGFLSYPRRGVVAGGVAFPGQSSRGFIWNHGSLRLLGTARKPLGRAERHQSKPGRGWHRHRAGHRYLWPVTTSAVRFTATGARRLPKLPESIGDAQAHTINDHGLIVGVDDDANSREAVIWKRAASSV
jgi:hypothetical protein